MVSSERPDQLTPVELNLADAPQKRSAGDDASNLPGQPSRNKHKGGESFFDSIFGGQGL
jgi:hypothetical protein